MTGDGTGGIPWASADYCGLPDVYARLNAIERRLDAFGPVIGQIARLEMRLDVIEERSAEDARLLRRRAETALRMAV